MNQANKGWLALVATPIGNLEDITLRAVRTLREADLIAAEDTRRSRRLLQHFNINTRPQPYHAFNEHRQTSSLLDQVEAGRKVAVLTDAGTPAIADPGFLLVRNALARNIHPVVVPGVSALTFAVTAAALPVDKFVFAGFPPKKTARRRRFLEELQKLEQTCFVFAGPHLIPKLLTEIAAVFGPQTRLVLIREATKIHEQIIRGTAAGLAEEYAETKCKGEFVVTISGKEPVNSSGDTTPS